MENIRDFDETGLYKGFVKNQKGKKFPGRNPEVLPLGEAAKYDSFSGLMKDNVVLMDADEQPHSDILKKIIEGEQLGAYITDRDGGRGIHALMFNSDASLKKADKVMLACGVVVDFHPGYSLAGECLKYNGIERKTIYDNYPYQNIQKYFTPLPGYTMDFTNLGEGDGRNSTLFPYILRLGSAGLSKEEIRETFRILNKYVLKEPLPDSELETITRNEAFKKQLFFVKNKFQHDKFAEYIRNEYHVKRIHGQLHIYDNGVYISDIKAVQRAMIKEIPSLTTRQRNEVLNYLDVICIDEMPTKKLNLIAFSNGIYDINENKLLDFDPNIIITNKIPWDYNPNAYSELVDGVLDRLSCGDKDIRRCLEEIAGACFYRSATIGGGKCAVLLGNKANGKSTYLHMLESMIGDSNYTSLDIAELKRRFNTVMLFGKLANFGDDISSDYIADTSVIKKMATGESVKVEKKGQDPFIFTPYATHIFSANDMPRMKDPTGAVQRRLLIIPLNGTFTKDSPGYDPNIKDKLSQPECMEYFIQCALDGLADLLKNKSFHTPEQVQQELAEYEVQNNPVLSFIQEVGKKEIINEPTDDVFRRYQVFCNDNGFKASSKITFSKSINSHLGTKTKQTKVNGKNIKIYIAG